MSRVASPREKPATASDLRAQEKATQEDPPQRARSARERLLDGAVRVILETSFRDASVQDILNAANVSRRTFYQHFDNKDALAAALFEHAASVLVSDANAQLVSADSSVERMYAGFRAYLDLFDKHHRLLRTLTVEALRPGSPLAAPRARAIELLVAFVHADIARTTTPPPRGTIRFALLGMEAVLLDRYSQGPPDETERERLYSALMPTLQNLLLPSVQT